MSKPHHFALIGRNVSYSFSAEYFKNKFKKERLENFSYRNFGINDISELPELITTHKNLRGLNVTIPYKEAVIPFLHSLSKKAKTIGAVNTITISKKGKLKGYNTDWYGFKKALKPHLKPHHKKALILGTGGASKAVAYALGKLNIEFTFVSRTATEAFYSYDNLTSEIFNEYTIIINTTPLGTFPDVDNCPPLNYSLFTNKHIAFDLIYNPAQTKFLKLAGEQNAVCENGYNMLVYQAEKAWEIWNR